MLDLFHDIKGVDQSKQHPKFLLLKNNSLLRNEKNILLTWSEGFVDRDNKFVREFQETFHSSFWELFLYKLFTAAKFHLDQTHQMPDFLIASPEEFYVEAVIANIKNIGTQESERTLKDQLGILMPPYLRNDFYEEMNEAITRASNAINMKHKKIINDYKKYEWIKPGTPFVLAVGSFDQVNYGREYIYPMLALLYGLYFLPPQNSYCEKSEIIKPGTQSKIPIGIFTNNHYSEISAIIFSCTLTLGKLTSLSISRGNESLNSVICFRRTDRDSQEKFLLQEVSQDIPEDIADGVFVFHNPYAKNKLPNELFSKIAVTQLFFENKNLVYLGNDSPLIARLNTNKVVYQHEKIRFQECLRLYNRLSPKDFYE